MKKKILSLLLIISYSSVFLLSGCSSSKAAADTESSSQENEASFAEEIAAENSITLDGKLDTDQTLEGATVTVPSYLQGEDTKELSPIEESDSSVTYELNSTQQSELVNQAASQLQSSITEVLSDKKNYPHITKISVNEDCTEFTVLFSSHELTLYETTLRLSLYLVGDKYQLYCGIPEASLSTTVHYADASNGEIFLTGTSNELQEKQLN